MAVNTNDILEIAARAEFEGVEDVLNVYQYQYTGAPTILDSDAVDDLSNEVDDLYGFIVGNQSADYIYRDITIRNITQLAVLGVIPWPVKVAGTAPVDNLPPGVAGLINMATGIARVVLRKYFGGFVVSTLDTDGRFVSGVVAQFILFGLRLISPVDVLGRTYQYGHFSPKTLQFEVPTSVTATDIPGYQRRRKQGRGS